MKPRGGGKRFGGGGKPGGFRKGPGRGGKPGGFRKGPGGGGKRFSSGSDRGGGESRGGSYGDRAGGADRGGFRSERPPGAKRFSGGADRGGFRSERPPGAKRFSGGPDRAGPDRGGGESRGGFRSERPGGGKRFSGGGERGGGESRGGFRSERPPGAKRFSGGPDRGGGESRGGYRGGGESRGGFRSERPGGGFRGPKPSFKRERSFDPAPGAEAPAAEGEGFVPKSTTRFVFGVNPALEALRARSEEIERLYYAEGSMNPSVAGEILSRARDAGVRVDQVPRERLTAMADGGVHQGLVLEMREFKYAELDELTKDPGLVVVLDSLQDPQNVGAIIRSANAFGAKGVVLAKDRAAAITGSVAKASAGATEHTKIVRVTNLSRALEELKAAGYWTVAADPEGETLGERKLDGPLVVVIGAEGPGVRQGVLAQCDFKVRIPMLGQVASLNASVSAGILLYEIVRQRGARPAVAAPAK